MLMCATCPPVPYKLRQTSAILSSQTISNSQVPARCSLRIEGGSSLHNNPKPWLLVGLGNPGKKYEGTRHNVGFEMIDSIAQAEGISLNAIQSKALIGKGYICNAPVLLAKPQTYMNLSGESVGPLAVYYRIPFHHILLIVDMTELACGVMRLQAKGGHRAHNGVKNVIDNLKGNHDFPRLYIGVGAPPGLMDPKAYVLQQFSPMEREKRSFLFIGGLEKE
ncbi:chloroplastic group IIB intron splicing facilitator CRS2-A, chloroplastic isoform X2 [Cryptomeria japonica]|uniref:chloroplastic group IIB intron splicing facilitator CRS2-A, chloroplastic isoform X2 n=1 Tax=Cryptomeria japonica TaxID=3369 RepID=UPI0025AC769D|nr:chloroplastic group IIB intron splicing facilitator CRS2-A, chloroplastic isoform X2 [Cryptomeria japonica]